MLDEQLADHGERIVTASKIIQALKTTYLPNCLTFKWYSDTVGIQTLSTQVPETYEYRTFNTMVYCVF